VSGGVKLKVETASVVEMKAESKNPSDDLPNQCWTDRKIRALYTKENEGSDKENIGPLRGGWAEVAETLMKVWKYYSLLGMTYNARKERQTNGSLFEKILNLQK